MSDTSFQFIRNRFGDDYLHAVNRSCFDAVGARATFERHFGDGLARADTLYLVVGCDSGLLVQWAAAQRAKGSRFLFIELPELVEPLRQRCAGLLQDDILHIAGPEEWQGLSDAFRFSDYAYLGQFELVVSLGARDANLPAYRLLEQRISDYVTTFRRDIAVQMGNRVFLQRQIENLADNRIPAAILRDTFDGATAVVLGGGPSLDDILPWVMAHREHLLVIAVSRIARRLLQAGLSPDIVVSIDPHALSFDVSREALRFDERTLLVHSYHVEPHLLAQWAGPTLYCGERYPWPSRQVIDNLPNVGPTVTNLALRLAVEMGCHQVVLGGVDLCFSRDGHTHAQGSNEHAAGPRLSDAGRQVVTNDGETADTDHAFAQAVELVGRQAEAALQRGCRILNPAPGAARIPHVEHVALPDITLSDDALDAPRRLADRLAPWDIERERQALDEAARELARARRQTREVEKLCEQALRDNARLFGDEQRDGDFCHKKRMDKIERRLDREFRDITPIVKNFGLQDFLRLLRPGDDDWNDEELHDWGERYYSVYRDAARALLECIDQAQERVRSRLRELDPDTPLPALAKTWCAQDIPGRFRWLRRRCPERLSDAASHALLDGLQKALDTQIDAEDSPHAQRTRELHRLGPVRGRLLLAFEQDNHDELQRLAEVLATLRGDEAGELTALARGYLAELNAAPDTAWREYETIVAAAAERIDAQTTANPRLEDALRRMSQITLQRQDTHTALQVLDALAALSPAYEPQYAQLLRLAGRIQEAVDVYVDYLKKVPDDHTVMLRLGQLFQEAGALESARWAYEQVLDNDPGHDTALQLRASLEEAGAPA